MAQNKPYDTKSLRDVEPQDEDLEPCVQYVADSWDKWDSHWSSKMNEFERFYDRWIGKPPRRDQDWQAQFHKRLTWQGEKTLVARYYDALFPTSAPIDIDTVEVRDELVGIIAKSTVAHWFKVGKVGKDFLKGLRSAAIYGTGLFEDDWYVRTERIPEYVDKDIDDYRPMVDENKRPLLDEDGNVRSEKVGTKKVQREEWKYKVVEDRYRVRKSNIFSWRVHPDKLDDDDDYPVIKQEFVNFDTLKERQREAQKLGFSAYDNMEEIEKDLVRVDDKDKARLMKDGTFFDEDNPSLELLYYWGLYDDEKGEGKKPMWIGVVNRRWRLFKWDNPRWDKKPPLFHIVWTEDDKPSYYGIGLAQIGAAAEDRANDVINIRTDMKKKMVKGTGWYNAMDKKIKPKHLTNTTPGFMRPCSDIDNAARYDPTPTLTPDDYKEEETAVNDHREMTGATTALLPPADKKDQPDTLGGMRINLSQALGRLKPDLSMMEYDGIRRIANRAFMLTRQNLKQNLWIELVASEDQFKRLQLQKIFELNPRQIIGKINFHCTGLSESIQKSENIDKLLKFMEMSAKVPPLQMVTNYEAMGKQILLWLGLEDVEKFVRINPEFPLQITGGGQAQGGQIQRPQMPGQPGQAGGQIPGQAQGQAGGGLPPEVLARIAQSIRGQGQ